LFAETRPSGLVPQGSPACDHPASPPMRAAATSRKLSAQSRPCGSRRLRAGEPVALRLLDYRDNAAMLVLLHSLTRRVHRPVLTKALATLERGDTLACYKLDRIGRSVVHLAKLLEELEKRGVHFMTAEDGLSTKGSTGKLVLNILGSIAQFERDLILERTWAGLAAARTRGQRLGPPLKWSAPMAAKAHRLMEKDGLNANDTAKVLGVSRRTLFRGLKAARDHDVLAENSKHR
jgi:DNA invertase Pin-like site-specific DNA recombinase